MDVYSYPVHPVADLFPMLTDEQLGELAADIKLNGLQQPVVVYDGQVLDGRNRMAACKLADVVPSVSSYSGESPVGFIISVNLRRRHLSKEQKIALGLEIEPHFAEEAKKRQGTRNDIVEKVPRSCQAKSRDQAADAVGISGKSLQIAKLLKRKRPDLFALVVEGKLSLAKAKKTAKADADKKALSKAQRNIDEAKKIQLDSVCDVRHCAMRELLASGIKPDCIITDPPYPREFLNVYGEMAELAKEIPLVAVMCGQSYLPEIMADMSKHLKYRWMLAYMTPGGQSVQLWESKVNTFWKPILLFGNADYWIGDVAKSKTNDNDKRFHGWGQSETGMVDLINRLSKPGDLVCDPFVGGGTTAVASLALGRRFVGCDLDESCVKQTKERCYAGR